MYSQKQNKSALSINYPIPNRIKRITCNNNNFMQNQEGNILTAEIILPEYIILGKEGHKEVNPGSENKKGGRGIVNKEHKCGHSQIDLYQVPDYREYLIAQPGYKVLQALLVDVVKEEACQAQNVEQGIYGVP